MTLLLTRQRPIDDALLGQLFVDGQFECFTLENAGFEIPSGAYPVTITPSYRFGRLLPFVDHVPGRLGIRIHSGNLPADSTGCILVGQVIDGQSVRHSRLALDGLQPKLAQVLARGDEVTLTIQNAPTETITR